MPLTPTRPSPSRFAATRWSIVVAAAGLPAGSAARHAMNELAQM